MTDYVMAGPLDELAIDFDGDEIVTVEACNGDRFELGAIGQKGRCRVYIESILAAKGADTCDPTIFPLTIRVGKAA